jgi:hypothetical protein
VLYEGFPMALLVESAGGVASTGLFNGKVQRDHGLRRISATFTYDGGHFYI